MQRGMCGNQSIDMGPWNSKWGGGYATYGYWSLAECAPSQPKNTGRVLSPRATNSSVELGNGCGKLMNPRGSMLTFCLVAKRDCPFGLKSLVSPD